MPQFGILNAVGPRYPRRVRRTKWWAIFEPFLVIYIISRSPLRLGRLNHLLHPNVTAGVRMESVKQKTTFRFFLFFASFYFLYVGEKSSAPFGLVRSE